MHQSRSEVIKRIPIPRKGNKFVARALSHRTNAVPVVIAVRDMLQLARTAKEVKKMIHEKQLKINGKEVNDHREAIRLFNILEADKPYILKLTKTGKFEFEEAKEKTRPCKIVDKKLLSQGIVQLNLHDGTNVLSKDKTNVHDTVYLDASNKITKTVSLGKGSNVFIISGKYSGSEGKIESIKDNKLTIKMEDKTAELEKRSVIAL